MRAFQWLLAVKEALTIHVLLPAVFQDAATDEVDQVEEIDDARRFLVSACGNLVVIDDTKVVRFSHLSVAEYLEKKPQFSQDVCAATVANVCLKLLNHPHSVPPDVSIREVVWFNDAFDRFIHQGWHIYARQLHRNPTDGNRAGPLDCFLGTHQKSSSAYQDWSRRYSAYGTLYSTVPLKHSAAFAVALFGLDDVLSRWLKEADFDVDGTISWGQSLLGVAAASDHLLTAQLLIVGGANVNLGYEEGERSPLVDACAGGHIDVARLLLEADADVNAGWQGRYGNALIAACWIQRVDLVNLLIDYGADIDMEIPGRFGSALAAASEKGDLEIVRVLVDWDATINLPVGGNFGSALVASCHGGHLAVAQLLLEHGADPNLMLNGFFESALEVSCSRGHLAVVQLLLEYGADPNLTLNGKFGSALAASCYEGHLTVAQLLLKHGADPNLTLKGDYGSALVAAAAAAVFSLECEDDGESLIRILVDRGADVNAMTTGKYGSALAAACHRNKPQRVELLLQLGADANAMIDVQGIDWHCAMGAAFRAESHYSDKTASIVQQLLASGARLDSIVSKTFGTSLATTISCVPHPHDIIRTLLRRGLDINELVDGRYGSALVAAACCARPSVVRQLIVAGAKVDMELKKGEHGSALIAASYRGNLKVAKLLIENKADVNFRTGHGIFDSALAAAKCGNHSRLIKFLVVSGAVKDELVQEEDKYDASSSQRSVFAESDDDSSDEESGTEEGS